MPVTVLAAFAIGAVLASAEPAAPQRVEMEQEEVIVPVVEAEPIVIEEEPIVIEAPAPQKKKVAPPEVLGTSKLVLEVPEGATVFLGKKKLGAAPIAPMEIVEGRHLVRVEMGDSTFSEWLDVPPGGTFAYRLNLSEDAPAAAESAPDSK